MGGGSCSDLRVCACCTGGLRCCRGARGLPSRAPRAVAWPHAACAASRLEAAAWHKRAGCDMHSGDAPCASCSFALRATLAVATGAAAHTFALGSELSLALFRARTTSSATPAIAPIRSFLAAAHHHSSHNHHRYKVADPSRIQNPLPYIVNIAPVFGLACGKRMQAAASPGDT